VIAHLGVASIIYTLIMANLPDFDWDKVSKRGIGSGYSSAEKADLEQMYSETFSTLNEKEIMNALVVGVTDRDVLLNVGFKSDGLVPLSEFRDLPGLKVGDTVEVYIEKQEDAQGQLVISRKKARILSAWKNIEKSFEADEIIDALVKRRTKGGLIVDIYGIEAFLPGSQIDVKPIRDFDIYVGKTMEVKVVKINNTNDNVVVSHKILIEKDLEAQRQTILTNLEKGQILEGVIKNMTNFGVFIDLGGVDGLLHITDISWGRITHPNEVLKLDQRIRVVVMDFDEEKKRISLGMKQLELHPWDAVIANLEVGSKVKGKIVNVADYGAFLEIEPGVEGLIHVSEMSWSQHLRNPSEFLKVGDEIDAVVLTLDKEEKKMSLGIKQLAEDPWTNGTLLAKYAVGTKHSGTVRNMTNFGLFIELEEGIDGLVHISDLSWTKKVKHPSDYIKVGEKLDVIVLELDADNKRLALSHRHLEENPWDTFETVFTTGSEHECTVMSKSEKTASLELPYGVEGTAALKHLAKEDGTLAEAGEKLNFKVIEFHKEDKKIVMSHSKTWDKTEEAPAAKKETAKKAKKDDAGSTTTNTNTAEKSTMGDLGALSALKEQMENAAKKK
jgi:small subunit ribosomal protein S1